MVTQWYLVAPKQHLGPVVAVVCFPFLVSDSLPSASELCKLPLTGRHNAMLADHREADCNLFTFYTANLQTTFIACTGLHFHGGAPSSCIVTGLKQNLHATTAAIIAAGDSSGFGFGWFWVVTLRVGTSSGTHTCFLKMKRT